MVCKLCQYQDCMYIYIMYIYIYIMYIYIMYIYIMYIHIFKLMWVKSNYPNGLQIRLGQTCAILDSSLDAVITFQLQCLIEWLLELSNHSQRFKQKHNWYFQRSHGSSSQLNLVMTCCERSRYQLYTCTMCCHFKGSSTWAHNGLQAFLRTNICLSFHLCLNAVPAGPSEITHC